jgi:hypothetical protein
MLTDEDREAGWRAEPTGDGRFWALWGGTPAVDASGQRRTFATAQAADDAAEAQLRLNEDM